MNCHLHDFKTQTMLLDYEQEVIVITQRCTLCGVRFGHRMNLAIDVMKEIALHVEKRT